VIVTRADADPPPHIVKASSVGPVTLKTGRCHVAQRAIGYYRQKYRQHRTAMRSSGPPARVWYSCATAVRRAQEWRARAAAAKRTLAKWVAYHYHWWEWLPANWQALGACETGYGKRPGNFRHANSGFVSAFGISRSIYSRDADYHGVPHWNDANPPTPRQQYLAALGHYAMFGDGWTCPGP
jgi:hypothetical protein